MKSARNNGPGSAGQDLACLAEVRAQLVPHLSEIRKSWYKTLESCEPPLKHIALFAGLDLTQRANKPGKRSSHILQSKWQQDAEERGKELASLGVPAHFIGAAILLYVESCLPYLASEHPRSGIWIRTLISWSRHYQSFILLGYARQNDSEKQALNERVLEAERSHRNTGVELEEVHERERRSLARDLHDEIGHDLIVLKLYTQIISRDLNRGELAQVRRKLNESVQLITRILDTVRNLVFNLGPAVWNEQGFVPAIRLHARQFAARTGLHVSLVARRVPTPLPSRYESALYRVLQGALANVAAHASASHVNISLAASKSRLLMTIRDDGKGFNIESRMRTVARSYGLRAMRERIELLGGTVEFRSPRPIPGSNARGTSVQCELPLHNSDA